MSDERLASLSGVSRDASREAAAILARSILKVMVFGKDYRGARLGQDEHLFAAVAEALGASLLALREKSNMQGLLDMGASPRWLPGYIDPANAAEVFRHLKDFQRSGGTVIVVTHGATGEAVADRVVDMAAGRIV